MKIKREVIVEDGKVKYKVTIISNTPIYNPEIHAYSTIHYMIEDDFYTLEEWIKKVVRFNEEIQEQVEEAKKAWKEAYPEVEVE
jgi:hypothetical protein